MNRVAPRLGGRVPRIAGCPLSAAACLGVAALAEAAAGLVRERGPVVRLAVDMSGARDGHGGVRVHFVALVVLLCLCATLPVALPRPAMAVLAVTAADVVLLGFLHSATVAGLIAQLAAAYRAGRHGAHLAALAACPPFAVLALAGPEAAPFQVRAVLLASLVPAAALAGAALRARAEARESTAARRVMAGTLLENSARGERARIARELHDVVAHHISMIAVQAETARLATPGMPDAGAKRLLDIGDTARAALTEMRRLLGVLREDTRRPEARAPQPGLVEVLDLLDEARDVSGTAARLIVSGPPDPLDPGVELAAYRIVQESLTNARRHAPGAAVDVELHYTGDALRVRVRDNGPGGPAAPASGGHGLLGMRERAAAVGGEVRAGPAAGGGYLVEADLPTRAARPAASEGAR
ncbi:sensor histidine kinase [Actinomadura opuntiae]|uniref:sensor histidine kinase n=1 Tax=Actinomadura sp. OS1-43 TaxID=604315 RepID=UPI00255B0CFD|nr:sensor histidine kinase [Actinomadura sp. OS1-43]MDL4817722.1 sensor histidine kinase [Actinomadura sp. OS1-43]